MQDSERARLANSASYATREVIHGSPHLNHASVWAIYERMVRNVLRTVPPRPRVLDLGAGDGLASKVWVEAGAQLTAVDTSREQLDRLRKRHPGAIAIEADALDYLQQESMGFDVVSHVSALHHVPDYLALLEASANRVVPGGALLTFQDPLRYDRLPRGHYLAAQALYIPWRLTQGHLMLGIGNRLRWARGAYAPNSRNDFEEYHVIRKGVDSDAIGAQLANHFADVEIQMYFSSQARLAQWTGERLRIRSTFGFLATNRL